MNGIAIKDNPPNRNLIPMFLKPSPSPGQPKRVFEALTCPKKNILFTEEEGAEEHCQCGALALSNQRIFDWLDDIVWNGKS
jgi:hypothetical protein